MHPDAAQPPLRLTWIVAALGCAVCALLVQVGADARWLAVVGGAIAQAWRIPDAVPYAAASSSGWHDAPALGQLVFHGLEATLGDRGLILAQVVAVGVALGAVALGLRAAGAGDRAGGAVLLALLVGAPGSFLVARAELFSLALFPLLVLLLRADARALSRRIWLVVPLLALWANLHGGVLVGFAVAAAYLVVHRLRRRPAESAALLGFAALALLATPQLLHTVDYYAGVLRSEVAAEHYGLWAPLSPHQPLHALLVAVAVPLVVLAVRRRLAAWEALVIVATAAMTVLAWRDGIWLLLFVAVPAASGLSRPGGRPALSRRSAAAAALVPAVLLVAGLSREAYNPGAGPGLIHLAVAAAGPSPILADPLDSEKIALRGGKIWIGNPIDAFARADQRRYLAWLRGEVAGESILRARIRVVLVTRDSAAQRRLAHDPAFRKVAADREAVLYRLAG